ISGTCPEGYGDSNSSTLPFQTARSMPWYADLNRGEEPFPNAQCDIPSAYSPYVYLLIPPTHQNGVEQSKLPIRGVHPDYEFPGYIDAMNFQTHAWNLYTEDYHLFSDHYAQIE